MGLAVAGVAFELMRPSGNCQGWNQDGVVRITYLLRRRVSRILLTLRGLWSCEGTRRMSAVYDKTQAKSADFQISSVYSITYEMGRVRLSPFPEPHLRLRREQRSSTYLR